MRPLLWLLLLGACLPLTDAPAPVVLSAELVASGPLVRTLSVTLGSPAPVVVEYWTDGGPRLRVSSPENTRHILLLSRLRAGHAYQYRVLGTAYGGGFDAEPLPSDLAQVGFAASGSPTVPLVLVHLYRADGFKGYAAVDAAGDVVWYWRARDLPFGMTRRANGNFVFMDKGRGLVEVTPGGEVTHELPQDLANREMHHDVIATPANTLLFLAFDTRTVDGIPVKGESIWEWFPELGTVMKRWSSWDHLSVSADRGPRFTSEWMHANSLAIGPRGNVLVSIHYFDQIMSLSPDWRTIEWRFGGVNATIPVPDGEQFSGQHTARELSPGRILMFDNRVERGDYSRAVEFTLADGVAQKVWEWKAAPANFAFAVGAARRLSDGNTLVAFGMSAGLAGSTGPTEVYEVTPSGQVVWHLLVSNTQVMFRAEPLWSIGGETN